MGAHIVRRGGNLLVPDAQVGFNPTLQCYKRQKLTSSSSRTSRVATSATKAAGRPGTSMPSYDHTDLKKTTQQRQAEGLT